MLSAVSGNWAMGRIIVHVSLRDMQAYLASTLSKQVLELVSDDVVYLRFSSVFKVYEALNLTYCMECI
jgi:transcriptional regulator NrdR family protein